MFGLYCTFLILRNWSLFPSTVTYYHSLTYFRFHQAKQPKNISTKSKSKYDVKSRDSSDVHMVECQAYETVVKAKASETDRANTEAAGVYEAI